MVRSAWTLLAAAMLSGCLGVPASVEPVQGFDLNRYLGKWYEIARLDHSFEEGLDNVTAVYSLRDDGGVNVVNRGFLSKDDVYQEAQGRAYFVNDSDEGYLKVSFFRPFYASYVIFELDQDGYQYAFVSGPDTSFLWLLSRTPTVEQALLDHFIETSASLGFDTEELIFPIQK
jgi:apolipoprotein D and lipocalin family protein|tara:strand:- start:34 stop:552 length:519 start_codon:yes stop_codon:yes gene_type:complete